MPSRSYRSPSRKSKSKNRHPPNFYRNSLSNGSASIATGVRSTTNSVLEYSWQRLCCCLKSETSRQASCCFRSFTASCCIVSDNQPVCLATDRGRRGTLLQIGYYLPKQWPFRGRQWPPQPSGELTSAVKPTISPRCP